MEKIEIKNRQIIHEYLKYCRGAKGYAKSTIDKYAQCINKWQRCFQNDDLVSFDRAQCDAFIDFLKIESEKNSTSLSNQYDVLRHVKKFFLWLSEQKGYEKMRKTDLEYLRLSKKETKIALIRKDKDIPTLEEIKKIVTSIKGSSEVARRDKALIAFLILTGIRISAAASLPMESFDPRKLFVEQSPAMGVKTKNSKLIISTFLPIGWDEGEKIFLDWYNHLQSVKNFGPRKPIFPATVPFSDKKISEKFWKSSAPARNMIYERCREANLQNYNPHSFRHAAVAKVSEKGLVEIDKRSISLVLGHEHIGTTFGSYGYGSITPRQAAERVREMRKEKGSAQNLNNAEIRNKINELFPD